VVRHAARFLLALLLGVAGERAAWEVRKLRAAGRLRRTERRMEALVARPVPPNPAWERYVYDYLNGPDGPVKRA
jgi:hypothetical protein